MSYDSIEKSNAGSTPALFLQFTRGNQTWRYTTADRDIMLNGVPWSATPLQVGDQSQSGNSDSDSLDIVASNYLEVAQSFRGQTPSDRIKLVIFQAHALGNIPVVTFDAELAAVWVGEISDVKQGSNDRLTVTCKTLSSAFDREGLGPAWGRNCNHIIYDHRCRVDRNQFRTVTNVEALSGNAITAPAFAGFVDGYFDGGYVEWAIGDGIYQRIGIERHFGNVVKLLGTTEMLALGQQFNAYPGCPQTIDACRDKFNNVPNYGGCDIMSGTSPFDGNPVF